MLALKQKQTNKRVKMTNKTNVSTSIIGSYPQFQTQAYNKQFKPQFKQVESQDETLGELLLSLANRIERWNMRNCS